MKRFVIQQSLVVSRLIRRSISVPKHVNGAKLRRLFCYQFHNQYFKKLLFSTNTNGFEYSAAADETLEQLAELLGELESKYDGEVDIELSQGVLKLNLFSKGCWVINKQTPNKQIWWSSPLSGPRRYELTEGILRHEDLANSWRHTRDNTNMLTALREEMLQATGVDILDTSS